jgi:hypothetical protein
MTKINVTYDFLPGAEVHPHLAGMERVPVAPARVREFANVPNTAQYACLARELKEFYPEDARPILIKYMLEFRQAVLHGSMLLLVGPPETTMARQWAGAAVLNEISMRYAFGHDVSTQWIGPGGARNLIEIGKHTTGAYLPMLNRMRDTQILLVIEPQYCRRGTAEGDLIDDLIAYRADHRRMAVVSVSSRETDPEKLFTALEESLGFQTADNLRRANHGYIARF